MYLYKVTIYTPMQNKLILLSYNKMNTLKLVFKKMHNKIW